jgi:hypothetical protein
MWLLVSDSLAERPEGFYCHVKQRVLIFYLPVVHLWSLRRQYNMVDEIECRLKAE